MALAQEEVSSQDMLGATTMFHQHVFSFIKPMALKCAVDLGIPDAIAQCGGAATIADIAAHTSVHPAKLPDLCRLMKLLSTSGIFGVTTTTDNGGSSEAVYTQTTVSRLVLGSRSLSPVVRFVVNPISITPFFEMHRWLRSEPATVKSLFELGHGCSRWEMAHEDNSVLNEAMFAESQLLMEVVLRDHGDIFRGLSSLVDVGGGHGAAAAAIVRAFPHVKCTVMDLPHVVSDAPAPATDDKLHFVAGNMFESIPEANAVLLKYVLHCWGHDECVKILRRCKEAIPPRDAGGKVIIIEMVTGSGLSDRNFTELEAMHSIFMMCISGVEREEHEWKKIFTDAGFSDYKIRAIMGPLSMIEVYP